MVPASGMGRVRPNERNVIRAISSREWLDDCIWCARPVTHHARKRPIRGKPRCFLTRFSRESLAPRVRTLNGNTLTVRAPAPHECPPTTHDSRDRVMRRLLTTRPATLAFLLVAAVFAVDLCLPLGVASAVPYTFAVLLAARRETRLDRARRRGAVRRTDVGEDGDRPGSRHDRDVEGDRQPRSRAVRHRHDDAPRPASPARRSEEPAARSGPRAHESARGRGRTRGGCSRTN